MNSVEQFFSEVSQDPILQQQLQSISEGEARVNKVVELGQGKGYNFTSTEVEQWLQNRRQELSDAELDAVAGGDVGYIGGEIRMHEIDTPVFEGIFNAMREYLHGMGEGGNPPLR